MFVVAILLSVFVISGEEKEIRERLAAEGVTVSNIEQRFVSLGPFHYRDKHHRVYEITTNDGVYWVRTGGFGTDFYKETESGANYIELKW